MSSDNDIVLSVRNISKCFEMYEKPVHRLFQTLCAGKKKFYKEFWALKDVSFDVRRGECVGIIGKNGAGKSTLLQIITGTLAATSGEVSVKGRVAALLELGSGFNPEFTGRENVYLNASILGLSRDEVDARYEEILAFADIGDFIDQPVKTYSSGMMVRLAFAVQVLVDPDILIVDEALAVGDIAFQRKCNARMDELQSNGTTILLVTHDIETVKTRCDRTILISSGCVAFDGDALEGAFQYMRMLFPEETAVHLSGIGSDSNSRQKVIQTSPGYVLRTDTREGNEELRYGTAGAKITGIDIAGLLEPNIMVTPGNITIDVHCIWDSAYLRKSTAEGEYLPNINVGCGIMNVKNVLIFGINTYLHGLRINPFERSSATVRFTFPVPELPSGQYFVHASIQMGSQNHALHLDWGEKMVMLSVSARRYIPGEVGVKTEIAVI